jgi:hypothetical protein
VPKVLAVLPATKAGRYVQIENKIRAAVRYELAAGIPLLQYARRGSRPSGHET